MSKVTSFLEKNGSFIKENATGSTYYQIGLEVVRVSDHLPTQTIDGTLHIIQPQNTRNMYIVIMRNQLYSFDSYTKLRVFLENWIMIAKGFSNKVAKGETDQIIKLKNELKSVKQAAQRKLLPAGMIALSDFTLPQQNTIRSYIRQRVK